MESKNRLAQCGDRRRDGVGGAVLRGYRAVAGAAHAGPGPANPTATNEGKETMTGRSFAALLGGLGRRYGSVAVISGLVLASATAGLGSAAADSRPSGPAGGWHRGSVVFSQEVADFPLAQARSYLHATGFGSPAARHGVEIYRIVYRTVSSQGKPDIASGVLAIPADSQRHLQVVEFGHGTFVAKADAASVSAEDRGEVAMFAGAGYAAVEPDNLGLGLGPGAQPWLDPAAESSAAIDMIRAARVVAARKHRRLSSSILVTGFSAGGQAAMALSRALQQGAVRHLRLAAVAPISGPFDLLGAQLPASLDPTGPLNPKDSAYYLSYLVVATNHFHRLYASPRQVFRAPYDKTIPRLENGWHSDLQVLEALPASPQRLFTTAFLQRLAHPAGEILRILRAESSTCNWVPQVPVRLYAAHGDTQAYYLNSVDCQRALSAHGNNVPLIDLGDIDHFPSEHAGLPRVLRWFEQIRPPAPGTGTRAPRSYH